MGDKSKIEWCDASWTPIRARVKEDAKAIAEARGYTSLLPIIKPGRVGPHCEHVSQGCVRCYSETNNGRCLPHNGTGLPFNRQSRDLVDIFMDEKILQQPLHWKRPRKIFVCSQTDLFGEFVPSSLIIDCFEVMAAAPQHTYLILTKRPERIAPVLFGQEGHWYLGGGDYYGHIMLGVSCEDQPTADERIPKLLGCGWVGPFFCSYEPALGPVDFKRWIWPQGMLGIELDWIVAGGESGPHARPMQPEWARSVRHQCQDAGVPFFFKQITEKGRKIPYERFPEDLRVREFPK